MRKYHDVKCEEWSQLDQVTEPIQRVSASGDAGITEENGNSTRAKKPKDRLSDT